MTTPQPRVASNDPYEVFAYRTRTGEVVARIPLVGIPAWDGGLNVDGSWRVTVNLSAISKSLLTQVARPYWHWSWAVVQGATIHQAGPVLTEDFEDGGDDHTTFTGAGLWALYGKRKLVNAGRTSVSAILGVDADVSFGPGTVSDKGGAIPAANRNLSLHTIMKRLLENEQAKPGGAVPLGTLPDDIAGTSIRTYQGSTNTTRAKMYELTQDQNGPEFQLVPSFVDTSRNSIFHRVAIGNARLGQLGYPHAWRYGKACTKLGFNSDGGPMRDRDWDTGAGFDRNVKLGFAENMAGVTTGAFQTRPLLEDSGSQHTSNDNQAELDSYAAADLLLGRDETLNLNVEVTMEGDNGDGESPPSPSFARVSAGDTGILYVERHPRLPDGQYFIRVIKKGNAQTYKRGVLTTHLLGVTLT